ncbi:MAG: pirin family protein [Candidatus Binataceae bacterium]
MITLRKSEQRGASELSWLKSRHTFSFNEYFDPQQTGFSSLRVINNDIVAAGAGFAPHSHRDMEILTWILDGELAHRDSLGHGSIIKRGDIQRMSAGTGIQHSEFNPSKTAPVHFLQIWLLPERAGLEPGYEQRRVTGGEASAAMRLVASPDGRDGAVTIHQDARMYVGILESGGRASVELAHVRRAYVHLARGGITVNHTELLAGDGARVADEARLEFDAGPDGAEVIVFDLA